MNDTLSERVKRAIAASEALRAEIAAMYPPPAKEPTITVRELVRYIDALNEPMIDNSHPWEIGYRTALQSVRDRFAPACLKITEDQ